MFKSEMLYIVKLAYKHVKFENFPVGNTSEPRLKGGRVRRERGKGETDRGRLCHGCRWVPL